MKRIRIVILMMCMLVFACASFGQYHKIGKATHYGKRWHGRKTSSGELLHNDSLTCAHRTLPFGTILKVRDLSNDKVVYVKVNDRGPFSRAIIDLSYAAANSIGLETKGVSDVGIEVVSDANGVPLSRDEAFYVQLENPADGDKIGPYDSFADAAAMHEAMLSAHPEARVVLDRKK